MGLKGIDSIISAPLLKALCEMGHGDEIVFADMHFPAASIAKTCNAVLIHLDGKITLGFWVENSFFCFCGG